MTCSTCGSKDCVDVIYQRGYWWHRPCATWRDASLVDFPSGGMMIPYTIMTPEPNGGR